jgi:hypothetical protein
VLANGRVSQNITMSLIDDRRRDDVVGAKEPPKPTVMPLKITGNLTLANQLQNMEVNLPGRLIGKAFNSNEITGWLEEKAPNGVPFSLGGTPKNFSIKPLVSVADIIRPLVISELTKKLGGDKAGSVGGLIDKLSGRKPAEGAGAGATTQPAQEENDDPFGSLLEQFRKPKK